MRLWTLHPSHLDPAGLVAVWREGLLAQAVLLGKTRGYTRHPQLQRFQALDDPVSAIAGYLHEVRREADARGYRFDASRIADVPVFSSRIPETRGQLLYEWEHLGAKLERRSPGWFAARHRGVTPTANAVFRVVAGGVREWEKR